MNSLSMWMELRTSLPMCTKAILLLMFSAIMSFPQFLKHETDMIACYLIVPYMQHCYALVVTRNAVHNY